MSQTTISVHGYRPVTIHWHSTFAGRLGGSSNCVTLNARDIYCADGDINALTVAHEYGHTEQARRLGWRYLPWIAYCFLRYGYANSPAEKEANAFMWAHYQDFPNVVET